MNGRFLDATTDELNVSDVTCIICCEETTTAKKLLCGHLFHVHCLRSWRERQNTCPTCRSPIAPRTMDVLHQRDSMKPNWELACCRRRCSRSRRSNKQEREQAPNKIGCYIPKEDSSSKTSSLNGSCTKKCLGVQVLCENDAPAVFWKNGKITWMSDCKHVGHCLCGVQFIKTS
uniref:RING-type domain-containing protein n=1 Tax=Triticum aestivum TaxID=4565 RepID=A0A3B6NR83_WHEAT